MNGAGEALKGMESEDVAERLGSEIFCALASANAPGLALRWLLIWGAARGGSLRLRADAMHEVKWGNADCLVNAELSKKGFAQTPAGLLAVLGHPAAAAEAAKMDTGQDKLGEAERAQWEGLITAAWNVRSVALRLEQVRKWWNAASEGVELERELPAGAGARRRRAFRDLGMDWGAERAGGEFSRKPDGWSKGC